MVATDRGLTPPDTVASETEVPWTIVLVAGPRRPAPKALHVDVADRATDGLDESAPDEEGGDFQGLAEPEAPAHKPHGAKSCGVVNRRT